jgi:golgi apparatus protein 1
MNWWSQMYREELKDDKCRAEVRRLMERGARDYRFDDQLANACMDDRNKFCSDVQPVSVL